MPHRVCGECGYYNGKEIIEWSGRRDRLSRKPYWKTFGNRAFAIGAVAGTIHFDSVRVKPITGQIVTGEKVLDRSEAPAGQ